MATAELDFSRRDLLSFAKPKRRIPLVQSGGKSSSSSPSQHGPKISRRALLIAGIIAGTGTGVGILRLWEQTTPPETLESLVAQAKKMEDGYKAKDLSDKPTREKYAGVLAGIYAFYYPGYFSKQQLIDAVSWSDNLHQFATQALVSIGKNVTPTPKQVENERNTTAVTDNRRKKVIVNTAATSFQQRNIDAATSLPKGWNPLKTLRTALFHDFGHLVNERTDEEIFSALDPNSEFTEKRIEGFKFIGKDKIGRQASAFTDFNEAVVELLAKNIDLAYFGFHPNDMPSTTPGLDMDAIIRNTEQVLQAIGLNHQELAKLFKNSRLKEFLVILADKAGVGNNVSLKDKITSGSDIIEIIQENNQDLLQIYLEATKTANPSKD